MKIYYALIAYLIIFKVLAGENSLGCQQIVEENKNFTHCLAKIPDYPEPVHIYIPAKLNLNKPINMNIHFHGHNLKGYSHFDKKYGDYGSYLEKSNINSVLIIPESKGECSTYDQYFKTPLKSAQFIQSAKELFPEKMNINSLTFSGHSGAYRVLNTVLGQSDLEEKIKLPIKGVGLFDATYGNTSNIEKFAANKLKTGKNFLLFNSYVSGVKATAEPLSAALKDRFNKLINNDLNEILIANKECLDQINKTSSSDQASDLTKASLKILVNERLKIIPMPSTSFPANTTKLDLHFGILKEHGMAEYFRDLAF